MAHRTLPVFDEKGFVILRDYDGPAIPTEEWMGLEYMDWKSGGDTNFAPLASALGEMECAGFWDHGKPDKDGIWTKNKEIAPSLVRYVEAVGSRYGRVRVIKLNPSDEAFAVRQLHLDDNNRLNPEGEGWVVRSWLELTDNDATFILREDKEDEFTEFPHPVAQGDAVRDRHAAVVARGAQPGAGAALRAHHLVGVRRRVAGVDRRPAAGGGGRRRPLILVTGLRRRRWSRRSSDRTPRSCHPPTPRRSGTAELPWPSSPWSIRLVPSR